MSALACLLIPALRRASQQVRMIVTQSAWAMMALLVVDCILPLPRLPLWATAGENAVGGVGSAVNRAALTLWCTGALALLAHEVVGFFRLRKIMRDGEPNLESAWLREVESACESLGLKNVVDLRWSDRLGPCAAGWFKPVILLPRAAATWPMEMRAQVIVHELAHFRRRDLWVQIGTRLIAAVHWFNPLLLMLRRWFEAEREKACDALVVRYRGNAVGYAESLLALASTRPLCSFAPAVTLLPNGRSQLEKRIRELLACDTPRSRKWSMFDGVFAVGAILLLAACSISGPAPESMQSEVDLRLSADPFPGER